MPEPDRHPYPWRADCRYCNQVITYDPIGKSLPAFWTFRDAFGHHINCHGAPKRSGDRPGFHAPVQALSASGPVPAELLPTFEEYE